jgi:hypothetical protein
MTQADVDDAGNDAPRLTTQEKKELGELRRDKRRLEMEVERHQASGAAQEVD